jgi:hypothetical protein
MRMEIVFFLGEESFFWGQNSYRCNFFTPSMKFSHRNLNFYAPSGYITVYSLVENRSFK